MNSAPANPTPPPPKLARIVVIAVVIIVVLAAIACYESQLPGLFGPQALAIAASAPEAGHGTPESVTCEEPEIAMRRQVKAYACSLSGAGPAERYWRRARP